MLASASAGLAFPNAGLGAVHGLTAPIGGRLGAAHGQANAALLPSVMDYNVEACLPQHASIARAWDATAPAKEELAARHAIDLVRKMLIDLEIPTLAALGVTEANVESLAKDSMGEFSNNNSNPAPLTEAV